MNGITWYDSHASMVIVAWPAGRSNRSDLVPPMPTIVTTPPSTVTPGEAAAAGDPLAPPPEPLAPADCPKSAGMGVHAPMRTASTRPVASPVTLATLAPPLCAGPLSAAL